MGWMVVCRPLSGWANPNSMDDHKAQPDTTEDDKRGVGYSVAAFNDTKERCIGTTV